MRKYCEMFKGGVDPEGNFCRFPPHCACGAKQEKAKLAVEDALLLEEMARRLNRFNWQVSACGEDGKTQMEDIEELAPRVLKVMINYI